MVAIMRESWKESPKKKKSSKAKKSTSPSSSKVKGKSSSASQIRKQISKESARRRKMSSELSNFKIGYPTRKSAAKPAVEVAQKESSRIRGMYDSGKNLVYLGEEVVERIVLKKKRTSTRPAKKECSEDTKPQKINRSSK